MKFHSIVASQNWSRWMSVTAAFALLAFIGCGSMDGGGAGGGCTPPPSNQNDNVAGNDNVTGNDNEPAGNDNTVDNDNEPVDNENDNEPVDNDNTGGGGGNDNQTGNNDNVDPGNDNDVNNNDNEEDNVNDNSTGNANSNSNSNVNGNGNVNANNNSGGGGGGGGGGANEPLETKTSGDERACAAAPAVCDTVTLSLDNNITNQACFQSVQWSQVATDTIQVVLTPGTFGSATFSVPRVNQVTTSVDLHFNVTSTGCPEGTMGTANVSIQVANASWVGLPTCIEIGDVIDIDESTISVVTGNPANSLKLVTVEGLTNEDDYNPFNGVLSPTAGAGTTVMARIQVFGTAGLLDEVDQDIMIMANCP